MTDDTTNLAYDGSDPSELILRLVKGVVWDRVGADLPLAEQGCDQAVQHPPRQALFEEFGEPGRGRQHLHELMACVCPSPTRPLEILRELRSSADG